jgi:3,4-dihydroxyphenylacetate 2,3-dioxygenase
MSVSTLPIPGIAPPDILRAARIDLVVTDLEASRAFYRDVLGLLITEEDNEAVYFRACEEYLHHSLAIRKGPVAALKLLAFRVRSPKELNAADAYYRQLGVRVERVRAGTTRGIGAAVRIEDPLGFPIEYFYDTEHAERCTQHYESHGATPISRLDHFNVFAPSLPFGIDYYKALGFKVSEEITDDKGTVYGAWLYRKPTVHDIALTGGDGPRLHHVAFNTHERGQLLQICDLLGALRQSDRIERGPGRHGVSNAFYVYLRDPDGHRIEVYCQDYYTGDPDNPVIRWDVHDNQRRDWWGNPVVASWYTEGSAVLNLDGAPQPVRARKEDSEMKVTVGADGFTYTRPDQINIHGDRTR